MTIPLNGGRRMNDMEHLQQLMSEYKQTSDTLFRMLDDYLETPQKAPESILSDNTSNNTEN